MKPKTCKCGCGQKFTPTRPMQPTTDDFECKFRFAQKAAEESKRAREKKQRAEIRERKEKLKRRGDYVKEAQAAINKFRRTEELMKGSGCISCSRTQAEVVGTDGWKPGGAFDAGHFQSVGAKPELRFEPKNIWLQCKSCNGGSGKYAKKAATVAKSYEENLIAQEGIELVEWLKGPHEPKHYTIERLIEIRDHYRAKFREMNGADSRPASADE